MIELNVELGVNITMNGGVLVGGDDLIHLQKYLSNDQIEYFIEYAPYVRGLGRSDVGSLLEIVGHRWKTVQGWLHSAEFADQKFIKILLDILSRVETLFYMAAFENASPEAQLRSVSKRRKRLR